MIALGPMLLLLALLGAPLFAVIAASALWGYSREGIDLQALAIEFYGIAEMPILLAIPLFTFAGYLLSESGAPQRLVRLTNALLGWMPAGLAVVSLAAGASSRYWLSRGARSGPSPAGPGRTSKALRNGCRRPKLR
ncbi:MAG: TRAP transporter large permease subunit, partial [Xanthomonadales bacterium]|nr:TRAP transporter large permease subunit [Xanthomonadales bacterium]